MKSYVLFNFQNTEIPVLTADLIIPATNKADRKIQESAKKDGSFELAEQRYSSRFEIVDIPFFRHLKAGAASNASKNLINDDPKNIWNAYQKHKTQLRILCRNADKIIVASHGSIGSPDNFFMQEGKTSSFIRGNIEDMGAILCEVLYPGKQYHIGLYMCYGARSRNYTIDHDESFDDLNDLKTSAAYKLTEYLYDNAGAEVMMSSRYGTSGTTRLGGNSGSRYSTVEHRNINAATVRTLDEQFGFDRIKREFDELDALVKAKTLSVQNMKEEDSDKYYRFGNYNKSKKIADAVEINTKTKYGKFVFISDKKGHISVYRKYRVFGDPPEPLSNDKVKNWEQLL